MYERTTKHFFRFHFFTSCDVCTPSHLNSADCRCFCSAHKKNVRILCATGADEEKKNEIPFFPNQFSHFKNNSTFHKANRFQ